MHQSKFFTTQGLAVAAYSGHAADFKSKRASEVPGFRMTNVVVGIFIGLVHQLRAFPSKWSARCQDLFHALAAEENRLRREELLREIVSRNVLK
jgi:hypothetical protein